MCVVSGAEQVILVSPIYKQNVYSGVYDELDPTVTPIDFFNINYDKFPLARFANFLTQTVQKG